MFHLYITLKIQNKTICFNSSITKIQFIFQPIISYLQMEELNVERLVDEYSAGEISSPNLDVKLTYQNYDELLRLLSTRNINIQQAMTTILPILHKDIIIPSKISNLTRKVRKHVDSGKNVDEVISSLYPSQKNENEISPFCTEAGISVESLLKEKPVNVLPRYLTNQLVYDLEKFRQRSSTPWSEAVKWHNKLFPLNKDDSVTEKNINKKWSRNYKRIQHMKVTQSRKLNEYLESPHAPPLKKRSSKEEVLHNLANPPMDQINVGS